MLSVSPTGGVNQAMTDWGDVLLTKYGKERYAYRRDLAVRQLGYSTDNGGKHSNGCARFAKSSLVAHLYVRVDPASVLLLPHGSEQDLGADAHRCSEECRSAGHPLFLHPPR